MTHLFLSPHYDDAVYSCGGTIYQLTQQGETVIILTLMSGNLPLPLPDTPIIRDVHQRWEAGDNPVLTRRTEDEHAVRIVGADVLYTDVPDCIYRVSHSGEALYPTEDSLWGTIHADDPAPQQLRSLALPQPLTMIYAPLGVGNHVDHKIVREWAVDLAKQYPVRFYTEYPYLRESEKVEQAKSAFTGRLHSEDVILTQAAIQIKIDAMAAYQSQISSFWQDRSAIAEEVRHTFTDASTGKIIERYWLLDTDDE
jgi:LmbE family N-acetylglucosaminyl deacetylase